MQTDKGSATTKSLKRVIDQSEQIKQAVEECAEDLATVNTALKDEISGGPPQPAVENAIEKSEAIEAKVQECADDLTKVNRALEAEVSARHALDDQVIAIKKEAILARHAAFHDPLTSLANRAKFDDRLDHGLAQARRHVRTLAVMFIDLDDFSVINDTYGHAAGDRVLQQTAERLLRMTRDEDTVSRRGGDKFLYLLTELGSEDDAAAVAQKVILTLSEPCEVGMDNILVTRVVTPSVGIAIFPKDGDDAATLLKAADIAMYRAKRNRLGYAFVR
jgi:diguanylate cyclase (GGDEF)-like protein